MKQTTKTTHPVLRMLVCTTLILGAFQVQAQNPKIKVYFNRLVNTAVSTGTPAVYLHNSMADTIAAYIKRSKYSVDIAQYDYSASSSGSTMAVIANACNAAQARGVVVRWIYDGSQPNSGLTLLNSGVNKLASPVTTGYIMHDKFTVIDVNSANASDAYILTGSNDWGVTQTDSCYNNLVVFQDKPLANAYYLEFNKMWGGTGATPVSANSKFGTAKTHSAVNSFNVNGTTVELFFSPKDSAEAHLAKAINTVNNELFFGIYTFTSTTIANLIKTKYQGGISAFGIMDSYSQTNTPYTTLSPVMGANLKVFTGATTYVVYHNKTMLIDPLSPSSDPQVFTGSYNWTSAGTAANDENSIIIHDATITNEYYQSFCHNFTDVGGTACPNIATGIEEAENASSLNLYPNPFTDELTIRLGSLAQHAKIRVFDRLGRTVLEEERSNTQEMILSLPGLGTGMYVVALDTDGQIRYRKVLK
ncbi:MAG TPA: phospholipase D-like domain-containing protein [Bacteroidia bacterium]|jgi:phosphatidylserine/phosphatidylglycerophosphate/cardiolipin synthase-like enzyme|nr:phospholipase D-like domain-containing protein [Bacteroidia bacterium]